MTHFRHFAAIDWSGAVGEWQRGIAVAICARGSTAPRLVRADQRWSRAAVLDWLLHHMPDDTLVGLDLGPSLPFEDRGAFFPEWDRSPPDARALWALVDEICAQDAHLAANSFVDHPDAARHFRRHGNRKGDLYGAGGGRLRETERAQREQGLNPYSNMNLVGAAQVGKSSLTGMRVLNRVQHRLPIWPFDSCPNDGSLIVEIYTSIAALAAGRAKGRTKMTSIAALNDALASPAIASEPMAVLDHIDDHRTDALLTSAWLRAVADRHALWSPRALQDNRSLAQTEGWTFGCI